MDAGLDVGLARIGDFGNLADGIPLHAQNQCLAVNQRHFVQQGNSLVQLQICQGHFLRFRVVVQRGGQAFVIGLGTAAALPLAQEINAPLPGHHIKVGFQSPLVINAQRVDSTQQLHKRLMHRILGQGGMFNNARSRVQHRAVIFAVYVFKVVFVVVAVQRGKIENQHVGSS